VAERATLVRSVLEHSRIPVILVPVAPRTNRVPSRSSRPTRRRLGPADGPIKPSRLPGGARHEANACGLRRNSIRPQGS
jgi:hypothetical protein